MELDRAVIALQKATGWHDIYRTKHDEICLRFNIQQASLISGLSSHNGFSLNFPGLDEIPLNFLVLEIPVNQTTALYRTLGGRLHSHRGLPSKVSMTPYTDENGNTRYIVYQDWHWYGVPHNDAGPASISYWGYHYDQQHPTTLDEIKPSQIIQFWTSANLTYYYQGHRCVWPKPHTVTLGEGWAFRERVPPYRFVHQPDVRSFWSKSSTFLYSRDPAQKDTNTEFLVSKLFIQDHQEEIEGARLQRSGRCMFEWNFNGTNYSGIEQPENCVKMMQWFRDDMLTRIDPWNSFFQNQQDKMILIAKIKEFGF